MAAMATVNQANWQHPETGEEKENMPKETELKIKWSKGVTARERETQTWSCVRSACTGIEYRFTYAIVFSPGRTWQCSVLFLSH